MEDSEAPSLDCEKGDVIKEDSSSGSEGLSSWFGNILDVTQLASSAEAMSRSAQTLVGDWHNKVVEKAEAAGEEMRAEQARLRAENDRNKKMMDGPSQLPWETEDESMQILSQDLMEQVMSLSLCDENFTKKPDSRLLCAIDFDFDAFVPVIMRLLEIDSNLAAVHAKLSPRMDETEFWRNYYLRVQYLRARIGMAGKAAKDGLGSEPQENIICRFKLKTGNVGGSNSANSGEEEVVFTDAEVEDEGKKAAEEKERARKLEQAALAAEVEAELLSGEVDVSDVDLDNLDLGDLELNDEDLEDLSDLDESGLAPTSLLDAEIARELDEEFGGADIDVDVDEEDDVDEEAAVDGDA